MIGNVTCKNVEEKHECKFVFYRPYELRCDGCLKTKLSTKMYPTECDGCPSGKCSDCPRELNEPKVKRKRADQFTLGWLAATAVLAGRDEDTHVAELLRAQGIETIAELDAVYGLEQYDRDLLAASIARNS